jgi:hypothetical protein
MQIGYPVAEAGNFSRTLLTLGCRLFSRQIAT